MTLSPLGGDRNPYLAGIEATASRVSARLDQPTIERRELTHDNVEEAGRQFEALFLAQLVKEMRKTLPEGLFGSGPGADTYEGWFDEHVGRTLAEAHTLDLVGILRAGLPAEGTLPAAALATARDTEATR